LVRSATTPTPPITSSSVAVTARGGEITRRSPSAATAMITAAITTVTQAAGGMASGLLRGGPLCGGPARPPGAGGHGADGAVGLGERLWYAVQLTGEQHAAREDVVRRPADALEGGEHAVQQGHEHRRDHHQQQDVADPPQDHDDSSAPGPLGGG